MQAESNFETQSQWLQRVESNPEEFKSWLIRQYHGECRAYEKITELANDVETSMAGSDGDFMPVVNLLLKIAEDEARHANYILALLSYYEYDPNEIESSNRYWQPVMNGVQSFDDMFAIGAHAEEMRLSRIEAVKNSTVFEDVVIKVFERIFQDETNHAKWFRELCSDEAYERMADNHKQGLNALGLEI